MVFAVLLNCHLRLVEFLSEAISLLNEGVVGGLCVCGLPLKVLVLVFFNHRLGKLLRPDRILIVHHDIDQSRSLAELDVHLRTEQTDKLSVHIGRTVFFGRGEFWVFVQSVGLNDPQEQRLTEQALLDRLQCVGCFVVLLINVLDVNDFLRLLLDQNDCA